MRLVNANYGIDICFSEQHPELLIFESECIMREAVNELWMQYSGKEGNYVLSENKILKIDKAMEMIINPFSIDFQNKKILSALYSKMSAIGNEKVEEKSCINSDLIKLLDNISDAVNYMGITYQLDFAWTELFKMYGVKIETPEDFLTRIIEYIKVLSETCQIFLFCFVNLKSYLSSDEIMELYKITSYNKINLLLIEHQETSKIEQEHITIIDKDRCLIIK